MENKGYKKPIIMSILVIVFVLIISGLTYAVFNYTSNANDNTVKSGQVTMTYIEQSNSYVLDKALPKHDEEGMNDPNYFEFTVTSSAKTSATDSLGIQIPYEINISSKQVEEGKQPLPEENIKVYLTRVEDGQEVAVTAPTKISELGNSLYRENATKIAYKLNAHKNGNETISTTYRLRAWIDFDTDASTWDGTITYQYKFTVNINSDTKYVGYTTDPACFAYEDDGNGGKKITGFSSTCSATNLVIPSTYTSKTLIPGETKQILNSYTANEEAWINQYKSDLLEEGQTYEDYLTANNLTDEQVIAEAKEGLKGITDLFDSYIGRDINETDDEELGSQVADIYNVLQDPSSEEYAIYSKIFTMNVETKTIPEHTEYKDYNITSIDTTDFQNKNIKTLILPETISLVGTNTFDGNSIDLLVDANGHLPDTCLTMEKTTLTGYNCGSMKRLDLSDKNITEIKDGNIDNLKGVFSEKGIETLTLPNTITKIGDCAFYKNNISSLKLPNSLTSIGNDAFYENKIGKVNFPDSLDTIGYGAFARNKLLSVDLSNTKVEVLLSDTFYNNNISDIKLPLSITTIYSDTFSYNKLTSVDLSPYTNLTFIGGFQNNQITSIKLPISVTELEFDAFTKNKLTKLDLSYLTNLKRIKGDDLVEYGAFSNNQITSLKLPDSVEIIGGFANNKLTSLDLSNTKATKIYSKAFFGNKITSASFPTTLNAIYDSAFSGCKLKELDLSNTSLTKISNDVFKNNRLTTVKLPSTVTELSSNAFYKKDDSNPDLTSIIYPGTTSFRWGEILGGSDSTTHLPPYTYNGVSITAS